MQQWSVEGSLPAARAFFSTALTPTGKVLLVGGEDAGHNNTNTSYLFTPGTNTWASTGALTYGRTDSVSITMTNGKILTVSGESKNFPGSPLSAEVYDPNTSLWTVVASPSHGHCQGAIWNLPSGKVLVAGGFLDGFTSNTTSAVAEIYDPVGDTWTTTNPMPYSSANLQYCSLGDGRALVAGGWNASIYTKSTAVYDEGTGLWVSHSGYGPAGAAGYTSTNAMTAITMASGDALIVGGQSDLSGADVKTYKFNHLTNTWSSVSDLPFSRMGMKTYLQSDSTIVAAGGVNSAGIPTVDALRYDPVGDTWTAISSLHTGRSGANNTGAWPTLLDGRCIIAGGQDAFGTQLSSTETLSAP